MKKPYLRRYTDIGALVYLLTERQITLLDPQSWDDSNDSYYLKLYRERKKLKSVLALCFCQATERYHHWRVFANGPSGARIRFNRLDLLTLIKRTTEVRAEEVEYLKLAEARHRMPDTEELPFLKRYPFADEHEFRIIYESKTRKLRSLNIPISLSCIDEITLSPWLPQPLFDDTRRLLKTIKGCDKLKIRRSTLIGNDDWKNLVGP